MSEIQNNPLVNCAWLLSRLDAQDIVVLDGTFILPNQERNAYDEFLAVHIPGAQFFDIDLIADRKNPLPHMLPSAEDFSAAVGDLGINNQTKVIVYDNNSFMASARIWWTFRVFGHHDVLVLNGGLKRWKATGGMVVSDSVQPVKNQFISHFNANLVCDLEGMRAVIENESHNILDARSSNRFSGAEAELRPGLRSGHIPGSLNLHYESLVNSETGELASLPELKALYGEAGINDKKPIVTTCGSGVTASILALGLFCQGYKSIPVYDGSWTEWGGRTDTPIETGR